MVNLCRRHLNDFQKVELIIPLEEIEKKLAKQRFEEHLPKKGQKGFQVIQGSNEHDIGKARDIVAHKVGVSPIFHRFVWVRQGVCVNCPRYLGEKTLVFNIPP